MIDTIARTESHFKGRPCTISTVRLPSGEYETMALYPSGDEIDCLRTPDRLEAERNHAAMAAAFELMHQEQQRRQQPRPLSGKYAKLAADLKAAHDATLEAFRDHEDGGTCNFDSPALYLPRWNAAQVKQAAEAAGVGCYKWTGIGRGCYVFPLRINGQGNRRSYAAEHMTELLKEAGYDALTYYQMD